jgi:hypothetical protein
MVIFFRLVPNIALPELKSSGRNVEEEYCLAITLAVYCGRSCSGVLEFGLQLDSLIWTYIICVLICDLRHTLRNIITA